MFDKTNRDCGIDQCGGVVWSERNGSMRVLYCSCTIVFAPSRSKI
jgi:hypothetical protein